MSLLIRSSFCSILCTDQFSSQCTYTAYRCVPNFGTKLEYLTKNLFFTKSSVYRVFLYQIPPFTERCILSFGWLTGVWILCADVSKHSFCSIFIGVVNRKIPAYTAYEDGTEFKLHGYTVHQQYWILFHYREHLRCIRNNSSTSAYATHILDNRHEFGPAEETLKLLKPCSKGSRMDCWESLFIHLHHRHKILIDEQQANDNKPLFELAFIPRDLMQPAWHSIL